MDAKQWAGRPRCLISRSALLHNAALIRRTVGPNVRVCAIVKADAYGHDARVVADTLCRWSIDELEAPMVDALAVADLQEAAGLGETGVPILVLRAVENAYIGAQRAGLEEAIERGWTLTICSTAAAEDLARIALARGRRAMVQVMVDTGMKRGGVGFEQAAGLLGKIAARPFLRLAGVYTHFACGEVSGHAFTREQLERFESATAHLRVTRHAANSGAIFMNEASHLDMVRPGISLYGIDPTGEPCVDRALRPVMKWVAPLIDVREIGAGETVGYGQSFLAPEVTRVGLVPVGYADGYQRAFSNRGRMMVQGKTAAVIGRVSMDLTTIDLTQVPGVGVGDVVTVLDSDPLSPASVYRLAEWGGTIPYEILCRIGARVRRSVVEEESDSETDLPAPDISADDHR